jgi:glucosamine-6-phosphate deaminase
VLADRQQMDGAAAEHAANAIRRALSSHGRARIVAATAASQLGFLARLTAVRDIDWGRVELFHLDEYVGIPATHPASFRRMLREHLIDKTGIQAVHFLDADGDLAEVRARVGNAIAARQVDVAFLGIGENAHLAFNDPPADFESTEPYLEVQLDNACREQQVREGWFANLQAVPRRAVSMSIRQILASNEILVIVPDARKAPAVRATLESEIGPRVPASALRRHGNVTLYVDEPAASLLSHEVRARYQASAATG